MQSNALRNFRVCSATLVVLAGLCLVPAASGGTVSHVAETQDFAHSGPYETYDPFSLTLASLPEPGVSGEVTFELRGDFNDTLEWARLEAEGVDFGRWLDNDPANDAFDAPAGDAGTEYGQTHLASASLTNDQLNGLIADGKAAFDFSFSPYSNKVSQPEYAAVTLSYDEATSGSAGQGPIVAPAPSAVAGGAGLLAGLALIGWWRSTGNRR